MDKATIIYALILLGLFVVYVINNNVTPKPAVQDSTLSLGSLTPTPTQTQALNLTPSPTSSLSSETSQTIYQI